jgi:hypothetical protein
MPTCDFYALAPDHEVILGFVFSNAEWRLLEAYSAPDQELRTFISATAVMRAFDLNREPAQLMLYAPEMRGRVTTRQIDLKPGALNSARVRYTVEGWGLVQLLLEPARDGKLRASHTNHNSQTRAARWAPTYSETPEFVAEWDWAAVARISGRLVRHIRSLGVGKTGSRPILPAALEAQRAGDVSFAP